MDSCVDARDMRLLEGDRYTFAVLRRILGGPCDLVLTDHEKLILCHSAARYPVWLWTPDDLTESDRARAWALAEAHRPLSAGYRYNLKVELAEDFLARARAGGLPAAILTNMLAYDCPEPVPPGMPTDGAPEQCGMDDLDVAVAFRRSFSKAIGETPMDDAALREQVSEAIGRGAFFLWRNGAGEAVACCGCKPDGCLGPVYTKPEHRRRHYARHLVYHVTCHVAAMGLIPMLYTDADYLASNACYTGIGYVPRGRLCTIGVLHKQKSANP